MNKHKKPLVIYIGIGAVVILLNVVAWNSTAFCDAYIETVFPLWVNTYGRLTGLVPFSVGEIMLVLGVVLVGLAAMVWIVWLVARIINRRKRVACEPPVGCSRIICRICRGFYLFFAWTFLSVCFVMTLNCFILYHASTFSEVYFDCI